MPIRPPPEYCFVRSFGWNEDDSAVFITMEYLELGDLEAYLTYKFKESEVLCISRQILEGLKFMHDNGFAHRDLKPRVRRPSDYYSLSSPK